MELEMVHAVMRLLVREGADGDLIIFWLCCRRRREAFFYCLLHADSRCEHNVQIVGFDGKWRSVSEVAGCVQRML